MKNKSLVALGCLGVICLAAVPVFGGLANVAVPHDGIAASATDQNPVLIQAAPTGVILKSAVRQSSRNVANGSDSSPIGQIRSREGNSLGHANPSGAGANISDVFGSGSDRIDTWSVIARQSPYQGANHRDDLDLDRIDPVPLPAPMPHPAPVPVPGAVILGAVGFGIVGTVKRRNRR